MNSSASTTVAIVLLVMAMTVFAADDQRASAPATDTRAVGPRGPIGPDVPLGDAENARFDKRVAVEGRSAAAVQAACERAIKEGIRTGEKKGSKHINHRPLVRPL